MSPILAEVRKSLAKSLGKPTWTTATLNEPRQIQGLWDGVETDTGHPLLVHFLARLIEVFRVPARDPVKLARAVQLYSARHIKFFRERPERFASALRTITWGIGDCDDKARFIAACLRTFRIPIRLKVLHITFPPRKGESKGREVGHVYPQAWLAYPDPNRSQWVSLESVREYPMGYDPEERARARGLKVKVTYIGDQGEDQVHI